jgi:hypothetical protein
MNLLSVLYFPLVNVATQALKHAAPKIPPALLPIVNVAAGVAIAAGGSALGLPGAPAPATDPSTLALCGAAIAGIATIAHNVVKHLPE